MPLLEPDATRRGERRIESHAALACLGREGEGRADADPLVAAGAYALGLLRFGRGQDIAGARFLLEVQLNTAHFELL